MATYWIAAIGAGIGLVAAIVGAGPSILTVLLLKYVGGLAIGSAIATSLVVVAAMSVVALVPYARSGEVLWRAALDFGLASMTGAYFAGRMAGVIPEDVLLVIFLGAMLVAALAMLWQPPRPEGQGAPRRRAHYLLVLTVSGLLVGSLTGLVGLGGGFAVVPLLVVFARVPVRAAVGTSIMVIAMNTTAGVAGHLSHLAVDWRIAAYLGAAESAGSLLGVRVARHVGARALSRAFAGLMLVLAVVLLGGVVGR